MLAIGSNFVDRMNPCPYHHLWRNFCVIIVNTTLISDQAISLELNGHNEFDVFYLHDSHMYPVLKKVRFK